MATTSVPSAPKDERYDAKKQALEEEIDAKKKLIASLPDWGDISTREGRYERANHIKQLAEMEYKYELLLESKRIDSVVREHEEIHPPITGECPICLEDIPIRSAKSMLMFFCCGKGMCRKCDDVEGGRLNNRCPLCRAEFPRTYREEMNLTRRSAKNGRSWAQSRLGNCYRFGNDGYPVSMGKAVHWLTLAAEQKNPVAMYSLACLYKEGDVVEQSHSKSHELMMEAANHGYTEAQVALACWYYNGEAGFSVDYSKSLYYATLCCGQERRAVAEHNIGLLHREGDGGLKKSLCLAKHYFERSAKGGYEQAYCSYAKVLLELWENQYNGMSIPGHCVIPQVLHWLRKAAANGISAAAPQVKTIETWAKQKCSYCSRKEADGINETLKCCAKCKGAWYCGRDCQVKAWKDGHKFDCIKHE